MISKPIIFFCISTATGCLCALLFNYNIILDAAVAASFFMCVLLTKEKGYIFIFVCFFIIGFINFNLYFNINLKSTSAYKLRILTKNNYYSTGEYRGRKVNLEGKMKGIKEGEIIIVNGQFKNEPEFEKGTIGSFKISEILSATEDSITKLYDFKSMLYKKFYWQIGEDSAGKVMAIAFGDTSHLPPCDKEDFKKLGIVHAVSVSGLHMLVLFKVLISFLNLELTFAVCIFYAVFTGFQAATVRSLLMLMVYKYSKKLNKNYDFLSCISLTALILLIYKPYYIVDMGFMLSFLSTLGMTLYSRKLSRIFFRFPQKLNETLSVSISAQCFSMPYALFTINNFSFGFILGNLFVVPIFSGVVILGNLALICLPIRDLFNFIACFINIFLKAADGACSLLLKVTPPIVYVSAFNSLIILTLYICYIFVRKGYKKVIYIPAVMMLFVVLQYYSFVPVMSYVKLQNGYGYIIRNKFNSVLISNYTIEDEKEKTEVMQKMNVANIKNCENKKITVVVDKKYIINIDPKGENVKINKIGSQTPILSVENKTVKYDAVNCNKTYDIIKADNINKRDLPIDCMDFNIVMDKIAVFK